jgi:essential nuclear protein 1
VGLILRRHTSPTAPLPKLFKVIPSLPGWARILALTHPEEWSPQATYAATRLFISQMKPAQARVFLEGVLLGAIREDIQSNGGAGKKGNKPLNVHYYEAMKKAVYKPSAFYKGIVFPLLEVMPHRGDLRQQLMMLHAEWLYAQRSRHRGFRAR